MASCCYYYYLLFTKLTNFYINNVHLLFLLYKFWNQCSYYRYTTSANKTWLQRQQQKLRERKEMQLRDERQPHETRLFSELRTVQSRHMRPTASHRLDGYTSDTTAFADDDEDYSIPLHINTMHKNMNTSESSSTYSTLKSNYSTISRTERPFMAAKRAYERSAQVENYILNITVWHFRLTFYVELAQEFYKILCTH